MTLLGKIAERGPADWLMAAEALVLLAAFRVCLAMLPVRRIIGAIAQGKAGAQAGQANIAESDAAAARRVQWAVSAAARHSAVEFVCFPQALAGYTMLRRRGVRSTVVYGVARSPEGELLAHTWVDGGGADGAGGRGGGAVYGSGTVELKKLSVAGCRLLIEEPPSPRDQPFGSSLREIFPIGIYGYARMAGAMKNFDSARRDLLRLSSMGLAASAFSTRLQAHSCASTRLAGLLR